MSEAAAAIIPDQLELLSVVRHLAHELRQPLSGIESIAYYLEMVLPDADEKVQAQIARLRQMVQQANWVIEDTVHTVRSVPPDPFPFHVDQAVMLLTADLQMREEYNLHVSLAAPHASALLDRRQLEYLITTLLDFFRHVAQSAEPIALRTSESVGYLTITVETASAQGDPYTLRRLLDPHRASDDCDSALPLGSVRRMVEGNGGIFRLESLDSGLLRVEMDFPIVA